MAFAMFAGPVYAAAAAAALLRRPLSYAVTAKGRLRGGASWRTFQQHLGWAAVAGGLLAASFLRGYDYLPLRVWCGLTLLVGLTPPVLAGLSHLARRDRDARAPAPVRATAWARAVGRARVAPPADAPVPAGESRPPAGRRPARRSPRSTTDEATTFGITTPRSARAAKRTKSGHRSRQTRQTGDAR